MSAFGGNISDDIGQRVEIRQKMHILEQEIRLQQKLTVP